MVAHESDTHGSTGRGYAPTMVDDRSGGPVGSDLRLPARLVDGLPVRLVALARQGLLTPGEVERMLARLRRMRAADGERCDSDPEHTGARPRVDPAPATGAALAVTAP